MAKIEVTVREGRLLGNASDGVARFLGVPYAAAPVGQNRFMPPVPHPGWDGVRDATLPGATAPQRLKDFPGLDVKALVGDGWIRGDEYLNAHIWAPENAAHQLPVMVFIHGGGFVAGSNNAPVSDGSAFARSSVVCISLNYRMGIDGFLPIPGVPTNLGLRDMIAALNWVRENAASFGGDPDNVTVFGESAGAMAIADLMASPMAKGLFRRAIIQSGHGAMTRDITVAQRLVKKLAKLLKITPDAEGYRSITPEKAFDALEKVSLPTTRLDLRDDDGYEPVFGISRFVPVHGDDVLPQKPLDALKAGAGADVDLLIGSNAEEMNLYLVATGMRAKIGGWLATYLLHRSMPKARKVLKAYGLGQKGRKAGYVLTDAMHDLVFRWPARRFAEEHQGRTFMYEFEWRSPAFAGELGACHAVELPFVFNSLATTTGPEGICGEAPPQELSDRMHKIWVDFATDGSFPCSEFDRESRCVFQIGKGEAVIEPVMPAAAFLP